MAWRHGKEKNKRKKERQPVAAPVMLVAYVYILNSSGDPSRVRPRPCADRPAVRPASTSTSTRLDSTDGWMESMDGRMGPRKTEERMGDGDVLISYHVGAMLSLTDSEFHPVKHLDR